MEFLREPRLPVPPMPQGEVAVQAPPDIPKSVPVNPVARLLPVAMAVAAAGMMAVYFTSGAAAMRNPMFVFFPAMMLMSVLGTLAYGARGANRSAELNQGRQHYLRYIDTLDGAVRRTAEDHHRSLHWGHPEPGTLWTLAGGRRMWERRPDDPDFCLIRVACGDKELSTPLAMPDLGPVEELDPVTVTAMRRLVRQRSVVKNVPIAVPLRAFAVVTIDGDTQRARALLRAMVCQLTVLHGPEHLAIAPVVGPGVQDDWDWLKWLPHHQGVYGDLSQALRDAMSPDCDVPRHAAVILDGGATKGIQRVMSASSLGGVTVVEVGSTLEKAVTTHQLRLHVGADGLTGRSPEGDVTAGRPDALTQLEATVCAQRLAPYRPAVASTGGAHRTPAAVEWGTLMGIDDVDHVDPGQLWTTNRGRRIVRVPIGVSEHGDPVELDINEAARNGVGPHGLCVGATGSGKSEFLRTLTLGMIAAHPPDVLNLILVDFKGGATFLGLERARHVSAVITNLADEAHLVTRTNDALAGEMNRRQELLRAAGNYGNVTEYEHARSQGAELPPLPALFIVVDEFSELLSQHPDFADLFVAIGRLGRSLGMHLLLASQRLDEGRLRGLETHLSYRICLKTFSASESRAVLGVPDAYHLPTTPGAAYLKTSSGDLLRFQTAFVSGRYAAPRNDFRGMPTESVRPSLFTAAPVGETTDRATPAEVIATPTRSLLDAMLDRVAGHGPAAHRVWLPPLTKSPTLDMLIASEERGTLTVSIGLVDSPYQQRRDPLVVELAGPAGNVAVIGAPRSGKSTALRALMLALAQAHAPSQVGFYCLDFGGGSLFSMRRLPHVGSVAGRVDTDLCRRTIAVMESVMRTREALFRRWGIDSIADYRLRRAAGDQRVMEDPDGDVFLVVDGWATLRHEFDGLEGPITAIAARGLSFGVHVVVAASRWAELRPALKDQIATRIELRLGDPAESEMDRRRARLVMDAAPGRGITADGREMVIALPRWDGKATTDGLTEAIATSATRLQKQWSGHCAPPVELLPTRVRHRDLVARADEPRCATEILIGVGESELAPIALDFTEQPHLLVLGEPECGKSSLLRLLCLEIIRTNSAGDALLEIVDFRRTLLGVVETAHLAGYAASPAALAARLRALFDRLEARMPGEGVTQQELRNRSWWAGPEIFLVIDDYDLVAAATGNPLTPLADFLPHAKDLGLHVVVARRSGGAARAMFDPVLARMRELGCIELMMSASPDEGVLLGNVRPSPLPPGRATLITRKDANQLIQVGWTDRP